MIATITKSFTFESKESLEIKLIIDQESDRLIEISYSGSMVNKSATSIEKIKSVFTGSSIHDLPSIDLRDLSSGAIQLELWIFHRAIEKYLDLDFMVAQPKDVLCLCYGVTKSDIEREICNREEFDLSILKSETMATSACGSCKKFFTIEFEKIRKDHGIVNGFGQLPSRVDANGEWVRINGDPPSQVLMKLDDLLNQSKDLEKFKIEITDLQGYHLWLKVTLKDSSSMSSTDYKDLADLLRSIFYLRFGVRFTLHFVF